MTDEPHRPELLALATDVEHVYQVMQEVADLEQLLDEDINKSMEARASIKKLMTAPEFMETLARLECVKGKCLSLHVACTHQQSNSRLILFVKQVNPSGV